MKWGMKMRRNTPTWAKILIVMLVILFYGFFIWICFFETSNSNIAMNKNGSISIDDGKLTIQKDVKGYYDEETKTFYILGILTNNSSNNYDYISIEYHVYDKEGNVLGNAYANINRLKKGKSWRFKVTYEDIDASEVKTFKISNVETY